MFHAPDGSGSEIADLENQLAAVNQDGEPMDPDGNKGIPSDDTFNKTWDEHVSPTVEEKVEEVVEEEVVEEDPLEKYGLKDQYDSVEDGLKAISTNAGAVDALGDLLKRAGMDPSDDVIGDLTELLETNLEAEDPLFGGKTAPAATPAAPVDPAAFTAPLARQPGLAAVDFMTKYPHLKWDKNFLTSLSAAMQDFTDTPEKIDTSAYVNAKSHKDTVDRLVNLNRRVFTEHLINEHIMDRMASGQDVPAGYRVSLKKQMAANPKPVERAYRGFVTRGTYNGVMGAYATSVLGSRSDNTGLSKAEEAALAKENEKAAAAKNTEKGRATAPAKGGTKTTKSLRDIENDLEAMGKKIL